MGLRRPHTATPTLIRELLERNGAQRLAGEIGFTHSLADPADPLWELECRKGLEGVKVGVVREGRWVGRVWVGGGGEVGVGDRGGKGGSRYL